MEGDVRECWREEGGGGDIQALGAAGWFLVGKSRFSAVCRPPVAGKHLVDALGHT